MSGSCTGTDSRTSLASNEADEDGQDVSEDMEYSVPSDFYRECFGGRCDFKVTGGGHMEEGVPTWHASDVGFSLVGDPVSMAVTDLFAAHREVPVTCYVIRILGAWDAGVQVGVRVVGEYGIYGISPSEDTDALTLEEIPEGHFELSRNLERRDWALYELEIRTLKVRGKIDFAVQKIGEGQATFYYAEITGKNTCSENAVRLD